MCNPAMIKLATVVFAAAAAAWSAGPLTAAEREEPKPAAKEPVVVFAEDFEKGLPKAWSPKPGIRLELVPVEGGAGQCLRVAGRERGSWYYLWGPQFSLQAGHKYRVSCRMLVKQLSGVGPPSLRVEFAAEAGGKREVDRIFTEEYAREKGGWQELSTQFACPQGIVGGSLALQKEDGAAEIEAYLDEVRVVEIAEFQDPAFQPGEAAERGHPRLFFTRRELAALKAKRQSQFAAPHFEALRKMAEAALGRPAVDGQKGEAWPSRQVLDIIPPCAFMYLLTGEDKYAARAKQELLATDTWPDWEQPKHRAMAKSDLASAETCLAVGCGYDWLYDYLSAEERRKVRDILLRRGIRPYLETVRARTGWAGWQPMNWTSVVDGGTGVGALAIYDEEPEAAAALAYARKDIRRFLQTWPPGPFDREGGYNEGVMYWHYGAYYLTLFGSAQSSALGGDGGLLDFEPLRKSPWFSMYFTAPDGIIVNFSDANEAKWSKGYGTAFAGLLAARCQGPDWAATRRACLWWADHGDGSPSWAACVFAFLWRPEEAAPAEPPELETAKLFPGVGWAVLRSQPRLAPKVYLAFKSGDLAANHTNYDLNSFILAAHGERLTCDPGYGVLPTADHSSVLVDGKGQERGGQGRILHCAKGEGFAYLLGDASGAYAGALSRFRRHVVFAGGGRAIVILDELAAAKPATFQWLLHSGLPVEPDAKSRSATVRGAKAELAVKVLRPADASLAARKARDNVLEVANPEKAGTLVFLTVLAPAEKGALSLEASAEEKDGELIVQARTAGGADRVRFRVSPDGQCALLSVNEAKWEPGK